MIVINDLPAVCTNEFQIHRLNNSAMMVNKARAELYYVDTLSNHLAVSVAPLFSPKWSCTSSSSSSDVVCIELREPEPCDTWDVRMAASPSGVGFEDAATGKLRCD